MSWSDNFPVYIYNLSPIYILSVIVSVVAVILTVVYQRYDKQKQNIMPAQSTAGDVDSTENENDDVISPIISGEFGGVLGRIKAAKQRVIERQLLGDDDCLLETQKLEKRTEKEQLEAIWSLLKDQEDKFLVTSKEEMQQQFRLYRT